MLASPGLAWQAALKMTNVKLDLFTEYDLHLLIERGIRSGVSMITYRYSEANNSQCPNYDSTKDNKWAMSPPLPVSDFEWISPDEISQHEIC
ncbi:hypothetical protein AVEN_7242-1 [Araneus ventricosus]|uniref:Uncharacterized protein n=1 Tax=Araneus ventricosus TaxID=182803 RepID=A0A4Y2HCE5_ARAVE|nr:hypothetical protein AVEN_7242-1 [Araneus ventricosus]